MNNWLMIRFFKGPEQFVWDFVPFDRTKKWSRFYLRIRLFGFGPNIYWEPTPIKP